MGDRRRVGRVAHEDQVGAHWHEPGIKLERERQDDPTDLMTRHAQGRLGLGELRVHDDRLPRAQDPCQQHKGLGRASREQDLVARPAMPGRDSVHCRPLAPGKRPGRCRGSVRPAIPVYRTTGR